MTALGSRAEGTAGSEVGESPSFAGEVGDSGVGVHCGGCRNCGRLGLGSVCGWELGCEGFRIGLKKAVIELFFAILLITMPKCTNSGKVCQTAEIMSPGPRGTELGPNHTWCCTAWRQLCRAA